MRVRLALQLRFAVRTPSSLHKVRQQQLQLVDSAVHQLAAATCVGCQVLDFSSSCIAVLCSRRAVAALQVTTAAVCSVFSATCSFYSQVQEQGLFGMPLVARPGPSQTLLWKADQ
ncbi:hypothetical protein SETIT_9G386400v2 [Setaria italica]|uniref:Uncharacterized protein n=1 Tax=Setaria italica TaxID=4555 RepID=K4AGV2_SETIT|nr:hypothetical protein SETIT_9G386400v2 [Setaria italica]